MPPPESQKSGFIDTQNVVSFFLSLLDRIATPQTRQRLYSAAFKFSYQRPVLSSFLALQILFALIPLSCFVGFSVCVILMIVTTALGVGVFWIGLAGIVLFWAVVISFTMAAWTWLFFAFCFVTIRWIGKTTGYIETPPPSSHRTQSRPGSDQPYRNETEKPYSNPPVIDEKKLNGEETEKSINMHTTPN